jgi:trehalose-6-phosphate synthase
MLLPAMLRRRAPDLSIGFFLHTPFPSSEVYRFLPTREEVLRGILGADYVSFQVGDYARHFRSSCLRVIGLDSGPDAIEVGGRRIGIGVDPIGIDTIGFRETIGDPETARFLGQLDEQYAGRKLILGVERLDYTKGIPQKLEAFGKLLEESPELRGKATLFQIVVPSREEIPGYRDHREAIERLVGRINGTFTSSGWVPIHYIYRSLEGPRLPAYYRAADVAFVTPLKDGMNLVAKEYCASRVSGDGVLVLSEFAGAAAELQKGALLVNPYDVEGVAATLRRALEMPGSEQRRRMQGLRRSIREHDLYHWLDAFLRAAISRDLAEFPRVEDYLPAAIAS